jgi:hypothetical protein
MPPIQSAVLPAPGHTSTGDSLPAPAGVVVAGAGSRFRVYRQIRFPQGRWVAHDRQVCRLSSTYLERKA